MKCFSIRTMWREATVSATHFRRWRSCSQVTKSFDYEVERSTSLGCQTVEGVCLAEVCNSRNMFSYIYKFKKMTCWVQHNLTHFHWPESTCLKLHSTVFNTWISQSLRLVVLHRTGKKLTTIRVSVHLVLKWIQWINYNRKNINTINTPGPSLLHSASKSKFKLPSSIFNRVWSIFLCRPPAPSVPLTTQRRTSSPRPHSRFVKPLLNLITNEDPCNRTRTVIRQKETGRR